MKPKYKIMFLLETFEEDIAEAAIKHLQSVHYEHTKVSYQLLIQEQEYNAPYMRLTPEEVNGRYRKATDFMRHIQSYSYKKGVEESEEESEED